ncbi:MAG: acyl carrier protein, partial [Terrimicrobiaceae bacterium]
MDMAPHSASTDSREAALLKLALELSREIHPARRTRGLMPDSSLERDAGLDSLARVELLLRVERRLGARLPDQTVLS